jgi:hypothetical protein
MPDKDEIVKNPGPGRGRMGGAGLGLGGECVCPKCGLRQPHDRAQPCYERTCPQCGTALYRSV